MEVNIPVEELRKRKLFVSAPMYGGMCAGMFTRSANDLSALAVHYGIEVRFYYLFNESLITRARNYCCDEFLRSDCTHMLFIDSDIGFSANDVLTMLALQSDESEYDVLCGPYPKKSLDYYTKVTTEDGVKTLGRIVKDKYTGKVLSYNEQKGFEFKPVLAHHKTEANGKQWVQLLSRDSYGKITATYDHEIATVEDVFNPSVTYRNAVDMEGRTLVRVPKVSTNGMNNENVAFSAEQLQFLYGTILGDSSIRKNGQLTCSHSAKASEYASMKSDLFGLKMVDGSVTIGDKVHATINLFGATNYQLKLLRELIYVDGKKTVKNIVDRLDIASFAMMYMDDGYYHAYNKTAMLCTEGFVKSDVEMLQHRLEALGFSCALEQAGNSY